MSDPAYPIKRLETLARREPLTGLATNAPVYVTHGIVLRTEFRPEAGGRGPIVDLVAKIFPNGSSTFPGLIIGMPALDVAPYGLGFSGLQGHLCVGYVGHSGAAAGFGPPRCP